MKDTNGTVTVGIDFGGDGLRVATDAEGHPAVIARMSTPLPRVFQIHNGNKEGAAGYHVFSLKRILDFEEKIDSHSNGFDVIDFVTQHFKNILKDVTLKSDFAAINSIAAIPPCFSQRKRSVLRTILVGAGFCRLKLIDDSLAVVLSSLERLQHCNTVLVYSWGASTFCASLYRKTGKWGFKPVIAPEGNHAIGGDDIDSALLTYLASTVSNFWEIDSDDHAQRLFSEVRRVKLDMSMGGQSSFDATIVGLRNSMQQGQGGAIKIPGAVFHDAVAAMTDKTFLLVEKVLKGADCLNPDAVLIAGGVTHIPEVSRRLEERFPGRIKRALENDVALGCVIQGRMLPPQEWEPREKRQKGFQDDLPGDKAEKTISGNERHDDAPLMRNEAGTWSEMLDILPLIERAESAHRNGRTDDTMASLRDAHNSLGSLRCILYNAAASEYLDAGKPDYAFPLLQNANNCSPANIGVARRYAELCIKYSDHALRKKDYRYALRYAQYAVTAINAISSVANNSSRRLLAASLYREACVWNALERTEEVEKILIECAELDPREHKYANALDRFLKKKRKTGGDAGSSNAVAGAKTKIQRNQPCPCGSGKKYKRCCLEKKR